MCENSTNELSSLRKTLGLTQVEMAEKMGMKGRAYHELESGRSATRQIHINAAERVALDIAIERGNPMLAPVTVRRAALELARLISG
ncbi:hypothetical protein AMST5_01692 [freshwater sediment metagenome]|uniref:HTH cro/C1-type domain-containing protein n=1 Tax=freshwater sediment metagenome TaxID=556182 RepID=A0AA48M0K1_9ZZZZ